MQGLEFAAHDYENILQNIVGVGWPDHSGNVTPERVLNTAQQVLESLAVITLRSQYPLCLLAGSSHSLPSILRGVIRQNSSGRHEYL
jgi:hypothetical protein